MSRTSFAARPLLLAAAGMLALTSVALAIAFAVAPNLGHAKSKPAWWCSGWPTVTPPPPGTDPGRSCR
jgi:hypothetical protein